MPLLTRIQIYLRKCLPTSKLPELPVPNGPHQAAAGVKAFGNSMLSILGCVYSCVALLSLRKRSLDFLRAIGLGCLIAAKSFPRFLELPQELQAMVLESALSPCPGRKRILNVGEGGYIDDGEFHVNEDPICIAERLRLVSRLVNLQVTTVGKLRAVYHSGAPSHRLHIQSSGAGMPRYLLSDTQRDVFYLTDRFVTERVKEPDWDWGTCAGCDLRKWRTKDGHPTWPTHPSTRPVHVIVSLRSLLTMMCFSDLELPCFLAFFGIYLDEPDAELHPCIIYPGRDWSRLDVTLKKVSVIVDDRTKPFITSQAIYDDFEPITHTGQRRPEPIQYLEAEWHRLRRDAEKLGITFAKLELVRLRR